MVQTERQKEEERVQLEKDEASRKQNLLEAMMLIAPKNLTVFDLWGMAMCMALGGVFAGWNIGLTAGFGSYVCATALVASGYVALVCSLAEVASALPFAGGSYGIARVTLGVFPGYMIACYDSVESIIYTATAVLAVGAQLGTAADTPYYVEIVFWFLSYGSVLALHMFGGHVMWRVALVLAVISILTLLMFVFGAAQHADFNRYAGIENQSGIEKWFNGGPGDFFRILPTACWLFIGVESINLASKDVKNPKKMIPQAYLAGITTLLLVVIPVIFLVCSVSPGTSFMIHTNQAMAEGFTSVYNMSIKMATVLSLPATYAIIYGFTFAYSRQLRSMGMSAIVNPWFGKTWKYNGAPYAALLGGSVMVFVLCFAAHFQKRLSDELFNLSILFACSTYIAQLVGYVYFVKKLSSIKRNYRSPLGVYGAYYSIFVFFCLFVSIIGFQGTQVAIIVYVGFSLIMAGYYFYAVKDRQYFSKEEQQVLFIAHVCQNNAKKARRSKTGGKRSTTAKRGPLTVLWMVITFQKDVIAPKQHRTSNRSSNRSSNQSLHSSHQFSIGSEHSVNGESIKGKLKKNKTDTAAPKAIAKPLLVKDDRPAPSTYSRISGNNKVAPDVVGTTIIGMLSQKAVKLSTTINSDSESLSLPALQADAHVESGGNALPEESMLKDCPPGTETVIENDEEEEEIGKEEEDEGDGEEANLNDLKEDGTLTLNRVESCYVQEENLLPQDCVPQTVEELEELMAVYNSSFKFGHDEIWRRSFTMSREVEGEPVKDNTIRTAIATAADRALFNV